MIQRMLAIWSLVFWMLSFKPVFSLSTLILIKRLFAADDAKSLQSCPTLCDPIDGSPPGSPVPGILQARTLEWVVIYFSNAWKWKVKVKSLIRVWLFTTPWTIAYQAPPFMGFSRWEYWSGVPLPSPDLLELHPKKMSFSSQGMECKSRKSRESWSNKQVLPWRTKWSRTKTEFCQENTLVIANILFQQHKRQIYIWTLLHIKAPVFWPLDGKSWLIWKDPDVGKDWGQEEKGTTEYEMIVWHHRLNGHGFE